MKRRIVRGGAVTLLIAVMAVTPLSVVFSAGRFETLISGSRLGRQWVSVTLQDHTGLVRGISPGRSDNLDPVTNPGGNRNVITVSWLGGCGDWSVDLSFRRSGSGYVISERTFEFGCSFLMIGIGHSVAIQLWSPVDAASVKFDSDHPLPGD
jgi:hypothetical protein